MQRTTVTPGIISTVGTVGPIGTITRDGDRVTVIGHVRAQNRSLLKELALDALAEHNRVTVDLRQAAYVDSSGVAALVALVQRARLAGADIVIANATVEFRDFTHRVPELHSVPMVDEASVQ